MPKSGLRKSWTFKNRSNMNIHLYKEHPAPSNPTRAVLLCHGLQSHYELEFCSALEKDETGEYQVRLNSPKSWARQLSGVEGLAVYGIDHQGHGASDAWRNQKTNVECFDDYCYDIIAALEEIAGKHTTEIPICLVGISLGGQIVARSLELMGMRSEKPLYNLKTVCLLAPALSIELLKAKPLNRVTLPFAPIVSKVLPTLKVGAVENHPIYPVVDYYKLKDPKAGTGKIPARLSAESLRTCDVINSDAHFIGKHNPDLRIHFIHSEADGFVDPDGSKHMFEKLSIKNKEISMLKKETGMWHFLTIEIGTLEHVLPKVLREIDLMH